MQIKEIKAKSIITKSKLPETDYVINPYVGAMQGGNYCYAQFMKKFTNHTEPWCQFLDIKINSIDLIPEKSNKYKNKSIGLCSVTDPYLPLEKKYKLTRGILERLIPLEPDIWILTKSDLIIRDIDLLKQFKNCRTAVSLGIMDDSVRKEIEPFASSVQQRINAIKKLKEAGIRTAIFICPIFPELTDWKAIVEKTKDYVDEFWFDTLNIYPGIYSNIKYWLKNYHPELLKKYEDIYFTQKKVCMSLSKDIAKYGIEKKMNFKIYFDTGE